MSKPNKVERFLGMIPLKVMLVVLVAGLVAQEQYPLSHYPMYAKFDDYDYYVYIVDQNNKPLALNVMRTSGGKVKKTFNRKVKVAAKKVDVRERELDRKIQGKLGVETLESYMGQIRPNDPRIEGVTEIRLIRVDLEAEGIDIKTDEWQVAAVPYPLQSS